MNRPLSTATLENPGRIVNLDQLSELVARGNHVPIWADRSLADSLVQHYGESGMIVAHPSVQSGVDFPPASSGYGPGGEPIGGDYQAPTGGGPVVLVNPPDAPYAGPVNTGGGAPPAQNQPPPATMGNIDPFAGAPITGAGPFPGGNANPGNPGYVAPGVGPQGNPASVAGPGSAAWRTLLGPAAKNL